MTRRLAVPWKEGHKTRLNMKEHIPNSESKIRRETIDISEAWDSVAEIDTVFGKLQELGIYEKDLLYRGTSKASLQKDIDNADSANKIIFCATEEDFRTNAKTGMMENPIEYALDHEDGVLVLFDPTKFESAVLQKGFYAYKLKKGASLKEAIQAIIELKR